MRATAGSAPIARSGRGRRCSRSSSGTIPISSTTPMRRPSQSHFSYRASAYFAGEPDEAEFFAWRRSHRVTIGHDVWIGHGAIVLPGRAIGTGAVIAAAAIVTKDVPAYTIVGGNPARPIRRRFPEAVADRLARL